MTAIDDKFDAVIASLQGVADGLTSALSTVTVARTAVVELKALVDAAQPPAVVIPVGNTVTVATAQHAINGQNVQRQTNYLVQYTPAGGSVTATNQYGVEVTVVGGAVTVVNDRQQSGSLVGTPVPTNGYVLSGHGTSRDWLLANATVGKTVTVADAPAAPPVVPPATGGFPRKSIAVYKMMWSSNGPDLSTIPANVNVVILAFAQGSPPALVGWGAQGRASFLSQAAAMRARGVRFLVSIGGSGGAVNVSDRVAFMTGLAAINAVLPLDGVDWDIESSAISLAAHMGHEVRFEGKRPVIPEPVMHATAGNILWISTQCKQTYGPKFAITFAPNGGNVDQYLPIAVACFEAGALDCYAQQLYDATVSLSAATGRIDQAITAGLPQSVIGVGMMIAGDSQHWTNQQCKDYVTAIHAKYPEITRVYLWEASRAGLGQWVSDMSGIIGS